MNDKGARLTVTVDAKFDGKDYPITGSPFFDSVAYRLLSRRTLQATTKKSGEVVLTETAVVSRDGKTLTATYSAADAHGKPLTGIAVLKKQ